MSTLAEPEFKYFSFSIEGMRCIKCIRKIQSISDDLKNIKRIKVNLGGGTVTVEALPRLFSSKEFQNRVKALGFEVKELQIDVDQKKRAKEYDRALLKKIGVSGACAGNIMILSAAEYSGVFVEDWGWGVGWLSFFCFLPVVLYAALPLYQNVINSIKNKKISIDTPIVLAVLLGAALSFYNLSFFGKDFYFDSISMFVFFLLGSRYLVQKIQGKYVSAVSVEDVYSQFEIEKIKDGRPVRVRIDEIKVEDHILVSQDSYIPFDSELVSENALISDAFFSGEFLPKQKNRMDKVFAGSKNIGGSIELRVKLKQEESRLSKIIDRLNISMSSRTKLSTFADRGANYLTYFILTSSVLIFVYFFISGQISEGVSRVLALLVVACPCGLAIATPLIQTLAVKKALRAALLVKDVSVFESIFKVKNAIFDKTGTLTEGGVGVSHWEPQAPNSFEKQIIYNLEDKSSHPIALALRKETGVQEKIDFSNFIEKFGSGVSGFFKGDKYELKASASENESSVVFLKNNIILLRAYLTDQVAAKAKDTVTYLKNLGVKPYILSGDKKNNVLTVAKDIGVPFNNAFYKKNPGEKENFTDSFGRDTLYVGDGVNDSLAMSKSLLSVSVDSSADVAFKSSQVHIISGGVSKIKNLFELSFTTCRSMKVMIFISLIYNLIFAVVAAFGYIGPLIAVILMPISSISVTLFGVYMMRQPFGEKI